MDRFVQEASMFKELGQMFGVMKNLPKIKEEMEKLQGRLAQLQAEGDAGGGMVKVRVNGHMEILACTISDEALKTNDKELLEDLIVGAANQALKKARVLVAEETSKMASGFGLPPGIKLPGVE
jgi:nucleoid-associated protein EbfC